MEIWSPDEEVSPEVLAKARIEQNIDCYAEIMNIYKYP